MDTSKGSDMKKSKVPKSDMAQVVIIKKKHRFPPAMVRYINNIVKDMQQRLGIKEYEIKTHFVETDLAHGHTEIQAASVLIDTVYLTAAIYIRPALRDDWEEENYKGVCNIITHELIHIYFEPIYNAFVEYIPGGTENKDMGDIMERQVQRTANAVQGILPKNYHMPSRWIGNS